MLNTTFASNRLIKPFPRYNMNVAPSSGNLVFVTFRSVQAVKKTNTQA